MKKNPFTGSNYRETLSKNKRCKINLEIIENENKIF